MVCPKHWYTLCHNLYYCCITLCNKNQIETHDSPLLYCYALVISFKNRSVYISEGHGFQYVALQVTGSQKIPFGTVYYEGFIMIGLLINILFLHQHQLVDVEWVSMIQPDTWKMLNVLEPILVAILIETSSFLLFLFDPYTLFSWDVLDARDAWFSHS